MITVEVRTDRRIRRREIDAARRTMADLDRYVDRPLVSARTYLDDDGRGKVLDLGRDGDDGLVEAAWAAG